MIKFFPPIWECLAPKPDYSGELRIVKSHGFLYITGHGESIMTFDHQEAGEIIRELKNN